MSKQWKPAEYCGQTAISVEAEPADEGPGCNCDGTS